MVESRTVIRWLGTLFVVIGLILFLYSVAYFRLAYREKGCAMPGGGTVDIVCYDHPWQSKLFRPAAKIETLLVGRNVTTAWEERLPDRIIAHDE